MKKLIRFFFLNSLVLLAVGCSNDSDPSGTDGVLQQDDIKLKIVQYYSSPSLPTEGIAGIKTAFDRKFPDAADIEWKVSNGVYQIDFDVNGVDHDAWYDDSANLLMYKYDIPNSRLSQAVQAAIAIDYPGYVLDETEKVYKGDVVGYYLDLKKNKEEIHAFYNENGTFISKNLWEDSSVKPGNDANSGTPAVDSNISDDEADALILAYYSGRDTDVSVTNVPSAVLANFNTLFPNARDIDWDTCAGIYKADFEINNVDYDAWYTQEGMLLAYKFDITRNSLPQAVKNTISTRFSGYTTDDAAKVIKANSTGYFVELENRNLEENAYIGEDGTYISNSFYKKSSVEDGIQEEPVTPEIPADGNYTNTQIDALLLAYQQGRDTDIKAQNVPAPVIAAFNTQFTSARDIDWDYVGNVYNVEFEIGGVDYEAWYVNDGTILMYTQEIRYSTVPVAVQSAISSKYSGYMIDGACYFRKGTIKGYMIELENKRTDAELIAVYNEDGTFIYQQRD